ncbi:MAG: hypothetical protein ACYSWU_26915, partial [Planctomycetota bacterium]
MRKRVVLQQNLLVLLAALATAAGAGGEIGDAAEPPVSGGARESGIAAKYPSDRGIAKDPAVIFADDFESWGGDGSKAPENTWGMHVRKTSRTHVVPGKADVRGSPGPGERVLEIACWQQTGGSQAGGLSRKLGNYSRPDEGLGDGYDEVYVRYYIKFDKDYRAVRNHGANLGGRDLTHENPAWVGMAAIRDVSSRGYFYSGLQPRGKSGSREVEMGFYSYHLDKKGPWGDAYEVQRRMPIKVGTWHCVERHMKLNSVDRKTGEANSDGLEELWVDGRPSIRRPALRFRRAPQLRISYFSLETYYHGLPKEFDQSNPIRVYFDNVVIARNYIGPVSTKTPSAKPDSA